MTSIKLNDQQVHGFIRDGYIAIEPKLSNDFHADIFAKIEKLFDTEGNPGNNLLARIPELQYIYNDPYVVGALSSIIGEDYYMEPHRALHFNQPHSTGQTLHKDSFTRRRHRARWFVTFYYPQNTPTEMGPTGVVPGSQCRNVIPEESYKSELPLSGSVGRVVIANYDIVHRGMPNMTDNNRYMIKFLFNRISEPIGPTWDHSESKWPSTNDVLDPMWSHLWDWLRADTTKFSSSFIDDPISTIKGDNEDAALAAAYSMSPRDTHYITPLINILTDGSAKTWLESVNEFNKPPGITTPSVHASYALSVIGEPALMELIDVLENSDENERILAAQTLADMGLRAKEAVPALCKAIKDQSKDVRAQAAEGLGQISQGTGDAIPSLIDALGDSSEDVRRNVTKSIIQLSDKAGDAVSALSKVLNDTNRYVIGNAVEALYRIGTKESNSVLLEYLKIARHCPRTFTDSMF